MLMEFTYLLLIVACVKVNDFEVYATNQYFRVNVHNYPDLVIGALS